MKILKQADFLHKKVDLAPHITFSHSGVITINKAALVLIEGGDYTEETSHKIIITEDSAGDYLIGAPDLKHASDAFNLRPAQKGKADLFCFNTAALVQSIVASKDLPLAKGKKPSVRFYIKTTEPEVFEGMRFYEIQI